MANLSKIKRDRLLAYIERLKEEHTDDEALILFNEIENALTEKRYGLIFEEHSEAVDDLLRENVPVLTAEPSMRICKNPSRPWNFIIEGDNLQALYLLEKTHKGKVDCIYIDPPYNTGATDWKYNNDYVGREDDYRHSKWLSMMKSRLQLAKKLLNPQNSVLICTIDEKEYLHLGCLLEEMFPDARIQMVSSVINTGGSIRTGEFSRTDEYIFFVKLGSSHVLPLALGKEWRGGKQTSEGPVLWRSMLRGGEASARADRPNMFYPIIVNKKSKEILSIDNPLPLEAKVSEYETPEGCYAIWPIRKDGSEGRWRIGVETARDNLQKGYIKVNGIGDRMTISYLASGVVESIEKGEIIVTGKGKNMEFECVEEHKIIPGTAWQIPSHDATKNGTFIVNNILKSRAFSFPKSLYAVHDAIRFFVADKPDAIIVDFFAGSGTTMHAVNLLNAEDGGNRRCIMVTNNEISAEEERRLTKEGYKKGDPEWEALGIARHVTWPRTLCSIQGVDASGAELKGDYQSVDRDGKAIPMARGFCCNVKYFKCEWVPRECDIGLAETLMEHIKEMIELEHAIEVDGETCCIILSEEEADALEKDWEKHSAMRHIYISRGVLLTTKQNELFQSRELHTIPDYYFDIEMKEVGESW